MGWFTEMLGTLVGADDRNAKLQAWGQSVPVSDAQREAMREIWNAWKVKRPPAVDPLAKLTDEDRDYIKRICGSDFRPREFGNADDFRVQGFQQCLQIGFSPAQAAVIVGMILNAVGPSILENA